MRPPFGLFVGEPNAQQLLALGRLLSWAGFLRALTPTGTNSPPPRAVLLGRTLQGPRAPQSSTCPVVPSLEQGLHQAGLPLLPLPQVAVWWGHGLVGAPLPSPPT